MAPSRKILHIDMDAFYASVEQRDRPELRGKPVAVGGGQRRSVVCAASYEARVFGVKSAMPGSLAKRLCPQIEFIKPRFEAYSAVSALIHEIFHRVTDRVEPLSLDEAYLDVTENRLNEPSATRVAEWIKRRIQEELALTASAGVSFNKFLAKVASGRDKPDGLTVVRPQDADAFTASLPVGDFYGVGPVTAARMEALGLKTGADLRRIGEEALISHFGKSGIWYWDLAWGRDDREVETGWERKSVGSENTFDRDLSKTEELQVELGKLCEDVSERLKRLETGGRTVTLKIKYDDFTVNTRSRTVPEILREAEDLNRIASNLLTRSEAPARSVRLLGVSVSKLASPQRELQLTFDTPTSEKEP
jgi:DNA polymerase-4